MALHMPPVVLSLDLPVALMALGQTETLAGNAREAKATFKQCFARLASKPVASALARHAASHKSWRPWFADPKLWVMLMRAAVKGAYFSLALDFAREAVERERAAPWLWVEFGLIASRVAQWGDARDAVRRARVMDARDPVAALAVDALEARRMAERTNAAVSMQSIVRLRRVLRSQRQREERIAALRIQAAARRHGAEQESRRTSSAALALQCGWRRAAAMHCLRNSRGAATVIANAWRCVEARHHFAYALAEQCVEKRAALAETRARLARLTKEAHEEGGYLAPPLTKLRAVRNKIEREHTSLGDLRELQVRSRCIPSPLPLPSPPCLSIGAPLRPTRKADPIPHPPRSPASHRTLLLTITASY